LLPAAVAAVVHPIMVAAAARVVIVLEQQLGCQLEFRIQWW
jgi:hypothetical protein